VHDEDDEDALFKRLDVKRAMHEGDVLRKLGCSFNP
jgi:hypothetical protein